MALDFENNKYDAEFEDSLKFLKIINNLDSVEKEVAKILLRYLLINMLLLMVFLWQFLSMKIA